MFGHVFRSGHAFCYHILCMFARLKCCFSARATHSLLHSDLTRLPYPRIVRGSSSFLPPTFLFIRPPPPFPSIFFLFFFFLYFRISRIRGPIFKLIRFGREVRVINGRKKNRGRRGIVAYSMLIEAVSRRKVN